MKHGRVVWLSAPFNRRQDAGQGPRCLGLTVDSAAVVPHAGGNDASIGQAFQQQCFGPAVGDPSSAQQEGNRAAGAQCARIVVVSRLSPA